MGIYYVGIYYVGIYYVSIYYVDIPHLLEQGIKLFGCSALYMLNTIIKCMPSNPLLLIEFFFIHSCSNIYFKYFYISEESI